MLRGTGLGLLLAAGLASVAAAQGPTPFDGQYVGELTLTKVVSGDCTQPPPAAVYPLTISGGEVRFAYVPRFDTTLRGHVDARGNFKAAARIHHGVVRMSGRIRGSSITAYIVSPSCNYTFRTR
jgi:hypothetical protein